MTTIDGVTVGPVTSAVYGALEGHLRAADARGAAPDVRPLLRFLAGCCAPAETAGAHIDRFAATGDLAAMTGGHLDWLAQFLAIDTRPFPPGLKRSVIASATFDAGSYASLVRTLERIIGGQGRYRIVRHDNSDPFQVRVYVHPADIGLTSWVTFDADYSSWPAFDDRWHYWSDFDGVDPSVATRAELAAITPAQVLIVFDPTWTFTWSIFDPAFPTWVEFDAHWPTWVEFDATTPDDL